MVSIIISILLSIGATVMPANNNTAAANTTSSQDSETVQAFGGTSSWNENTN